MTPLTYTESADWDFLSPDTPGDISCGEFGGEGVELEEEWWESVPLVSSVQPLGGKITPGMYHTKPGSQFDPHRSLKGLITLCVVSLAFFILILAFLIFSRVLERLRLQKPKPSA